ncbi:MAG TPA: sn-glycerol-3-phosphate ABC transporter ATP-binding protein UgpC [Lacunisphaera sp.]
MAQVTLTALEKSYPASARSSAFHAVKGIDLDIADGEFMVLVGPSGCGKSTTLRMIAGLEEISAGTVSIGGAVVNDLAPKDRGIAMVFQNYALYPHMSVFDNMAFGLKLARTPRPEIERRVQDAARILGLEAMLERRPAALSGGQRQRVAVGRAIVRQPKVFLFDEPLSNLDAKMRVSMRTEISRLHARLGATMIYVTHDQIEAMTMGDRICVMKDGRIMQVADPLTLYNRPANAYVAGFIGSPPMNLLRGAIRRRGGRLHFVGAGGAEAASFVLDGVLTARVAGNEGRPVIFGIRPEAIATVATEQAAALTARIDLAEPMGAETYVHLDCGSGTLVARLRADQRFVAGDHLTVYFDLARAYLFDAATEDVIG